MNLSIFYLMSDKMFYRHIQIVQIRVYYSDFPYMHISCIDNVSPSPVPFHLPPPSPMVHLLLDNHILKDFCMRENM